LNPGEDKPVNQDVETLSASQGRHDIGRFPGLRENLRAIWMAGAFDITDVIGPRGGSRKQTPAKNNKESIAQHLPLLGPGTHRATKTVIRLRNVGANWPKGQDVPKCHRLGRRGWVVFQSAADVAEGTRT